MSNHSVKNDEVAMQVLSTLRDTRKKLGLNIRQFAKEIGVSPTAIGSYELGVNIPHSEIYDKIAHFIGAPKYRQGRTLNLPSISTNDDVQQHIPFENSTQDTPNPTIEINRQSFDNLMTIARIKNIPANTLLNNIIDTALKPYLEAVRKIQQS